MRFLITHIATGMLVLLFLLQSMLPLCITAEFYFNRQFYYENLCINRDKPITICGGLCHLTTKLSTLADEHEEANIISAKNLQRELYCSERHEAEVNRPFNFSDHGLFLQPSKPTEWSKTIFHPPRL